MRSLILTLVIFLSTSFVGKFPQQPQTLTFTLTIAEAETAMKGLSKLPYEESAPVIQKFQQQAYAQLNPPVKVDSTKPKKN